MKQAALSDMICRKAKAKDRRYMLTDGRGLKLEVMTSGTKYWRFIYPVEGKRKTVTLGEYPAVSLVEARQKADELRAGMKRGITPRDALTPQHKATFREVAEEWFDKQAEHWAEGHAETVRHRLNGYLYPDLGNRPIADITAAEVLRVLRALEARKLYETAKRTRQIFGQVARYGVAIGVCAMDVSAPLVDALTAPKVKHFAAITEKEDIRRLLLAMEEYRGYAVVIPAIWLSLYTLARPGEIRHAEWSEIDLDSAVWEIPAEKMKRRKPHAVPLSRQAVALLRELKPLTGRGRYVFPSARGEGRPMSENAVRVALRNMGFTNDEMTAHGFRSLGSTMLNSLGYRADVIEAALAHVQPGVRGVYNRGDYWEDRVTMMQEWADWLDGLIE